MRKLRNIFIIFLGLFLMTGCFRSDEEKRQDKVNKILTHMEKKYGEKFYMSSPFGGRGKNDALRIMVKPERYRGSAREYDDFYEDYAFIKTDGKTGDGFGTVYLKEGAEEYFKPKLKELFGENVLITIVPEGRYVFVDFKEEMKRRSKVYNSNPIGNYSPLSGGIYIFGRVENEADREYYRKQIYEFIQYLKAEEMFDYVDLRVVIVDERVLSEEFRINKNKIVEMLKKIPSGDDISREEYSKNRINIMSLLDKNYAEKNNYTKVLENYNKKNITQNWGDELGEGTILLMFHTYGPKFILSRGFDKDSDPRVKRTVKYYNDISEVKILEGW